MKFENILANINGFGRFQIMIIVISFIGRFTLPCHSDLTGELHFLSYVKMYWITIMNIFKGEVTHVHA